MKIAITVTHRNLQAPKPEVRKYAIIKHRPRDTPGFNITFFPDTVPMQDEPRSTGKGHTIPILNPWWEYMRKINTPEGYYYNRSINLMWINIPYDQEDPNAIPKAESINCGGNFIAYEDETYTHVKLISYDHRMKTAELDPAVDNWHVRPWMFWKAVAIDVGGKLILPVVHGKAIDAYFPLIRYTELWMNRNDLEFFPSPPEGVIYELRGTDVYGWKDGKSEPLMTVENRVRTFHTDWFRLETYGVI